MFEDPLESHFQPTAEDHVDVSLSAVWSEARLMQVLNVIEIHWNCFRSTK